MNLILEKLLGPMLEKEGERISEKLENTPLKILHSKVLRIFKSHKIKATQIPIVVPGKYGINLNDVEDRKSFQTKMSGDF